MVTVVDMLVSYPLPPLGDTVVNMCFSVLVSVLAVKKLIGNFI